MRSTHAAALTPISPGSDREARYAPTKPPRATGTSGKTAAAAGLAETSPPLKSSAAAAPNAE